MCNENEKPGLRCLIYKGGGIGEDVNTFSSRHKSSVAAEGRTRSVEPLTKTRGSTGKVLVDILAVL